MKGLPRVLLGSAFLASPFFVVLLLLVEFSELDAIAAWVAAVLGYAGLVLLFRPLLTGLFAIEAALHVMTENDAAIPEIETLSPIARELWLTLARWARSTRATM